MPDFTPTNQDVRFRKADLKTGKESDYTPIQQGKKIVFLDHVVLEIQDQAGNNRLFYRDNSYTPRELNCSRTGDNQYWINKSSQYLARVCITDDSGMEYAIPENLPLYKGPAGEQNDTCVFSIAYKGSLKIKGDRFFNKVFSIVMR